MLYNIAMLIEDFFAPTGVDTWTNDPVDEPKMDLIRSLGGGPLAGDDDLDSAISLTRLVHAELEEFWTHARTERLNNGPARRDGP